MKIGDRVHLSGRKEVTGVIENISHDNLWGVDYTRYFIRYDDSDFIPAADWHEEYDLVLIKEKNSPEEVVCECGVDRVMENGRHSDYCPLYGLNEY